MFGFGKKEIEIFLEKYNYSLGENIVGKILLKLNKPTKSKALKVGLIGERLITETGRTTDGKISSHQRKEYVFNFEMPLDGEKEYSQGEYNFEIKIPTTLSQTSLPGGLAGDVIKTIQVLSGKQSNISWYVIAKLDISMGFDISNKIQINIG
jgi:hypothetical protein